MIRTTHLAPRKLADVRNHFTVTVLVNVLVTAPCSSTEHSLAGSKFLLSRPLTALHPRPLSLVECSLETCKINLCWESGDPNSTSMKHQWPRSCSHLSGSVSLPKKETWTTRQHFCKIVLETSFSKGQNRAMLCEGACVPAPVSHTTPQSFLSII